MMDCLLRNSYLPTFGTVCDFGVSSDGSTGVTDSRLQNSRRRHRRAGRGTTKFQAIRSDMAPFGDQKVTSTKQTEL